MINLEDSITTTKLDSSTFSKNMKTLVNITNNLDALEKLMNQFNTNFDGFEHKLTTSHIHGKSVSPNAIIEVSLQVE